MYGSKNYDFIAKIVLLQTYSKTHYIFISATLKFNTCQQFFLTLCHANPFATKTTNSSGGHTKMIIKFTMFRNNVYKHVF